MNPDIVLAALLVGAYGLVTWLAAGSARHRVWARVVAPGRPDLIRAPGGRPEVRVPCRGGPVTVQLESFGRGRLFSCAVPGALPPDLRLGPQREAGRADIRVGNWRVDTTFGIRGPAAWWIRETVGAPEVAGFLAAARDEAEGLRIEGGMVERRRGPEADEALVAESEQVAALAAALAEAAAAAWARRAAAWGLGLERVGHRGFRLVGQRAGVPVQLSWSGEGPRDPGRTTLDLVHGVALPADLLVRARGPDDPPGITLGDPILDRALRARGVAPATLRRFLARDRVREGLLEVLHGAPGARLEGPRLRLAVDGPDPDALLAWLDRAAALVAALAVAP